MTSSVCVTVRLLAAINAMDLMMKFVDDHDGRGGGPVDPTAFLLLKKFTLRRVTAAITDTLMTHADEESMTALNIHLQRPEVEDIIHALLSEQELDEDQLTGRLDGILGRETCRGHYHHVMGILRAHEDAIAMQVHNEIVADMQS